MSQFVDVVSGFEPCLIQVVIDYKDENGEHGNKNGQGFAHFINWLWQYLKL